MSATSPPDGPPSSAEEQRTASSTVVAPAFDPHLGVARIRAFLRGFGESCSSGSWELVRVLRETLPNQLRPMSVPERLALLSTVEYGWHRSVLVTALVELALRSSDVADLRIASFALSVWSRQSIGPKDYDDWKSGLVVLGTAVERSLAGRDDSEARRMRHDLERSRLEFMQMAHDFVLRAMSIHGSTNRRILLEVLLRGPTSSSLEESNALGDGIADRAEGIRLYTQQIALREAEALELTVPEDRALFEHRIGRALEQGLIGRAWELLQQYRSATSFSQMLARRLERDPSNEVVASLRSWANRFASDDAEAPLQRFRRRVSLERELWSALGTGGESVVERIRGLRSNQATLLAPGEVLVEFVPTPQETLAFLHRGDELPRLHRIPLGRAAIEAALQALLFGRSRFRPGRFESGWGLDWSDPTPTPELFALHGLVSWIPEQLDGARTLLVVPFGELHMVPFHALPVGSSPGSDYLVEHCDVGYLLSSTQTAWDPVVSGSTRACVAGAVRPGEDQDALALHLQAVARLVGNCEPLSGSAATPTALFPGGEERMLCKLLYIHGHGHHDTADPLGSGIQLSPTHRSTGIVDGRLLTSTPIAGELAFLSACLTGRARIRADDEILGMIRPLLLNGFGTVVTALWSFEAHSGRAIGEYFLSEWLLRGKDRVAALSAVQREVLHGTWGPELRNPYIWAPFKLIGDWK